MNKKIYWKIRKKILNALFKCKAAVFKRFEARETAKAYASFRSLIFKKTLNGGFKSIIIAALLMLLDSFVSNMLHTSPLDKTIFTDVIIGGIGVAGVILGLYCANISSIYTSIYTNAPEEVSTAFRNDKLTQKCISSIIDYIIFGFIVIAEVLSGFELGWGTVLIVILWSIIVIISYSIAGNRAYALANIYTVADDSYKLLDRVVSVYLIQDFFSLNADFQNHFSKVCSSQITLRKEILQFGKQAPKNYNASMEKFMKQNLLLVARYWENKGSIPRESFWFREKAKYQKWHFTGGMEVSLALETGTTLCSKGEKNRWWYEDELFSMNRQGIAYLIDNKDFSVLYTYLVFMQNLCKTAVAHKEINYYAGQIAYIKNLVKEVSLASSIEETEKNFAGVVEMLSLLYLGIVSEVGDYYQNYAIRHRI